jgi:hypothetical protein
MTAEDMTDHPDYIAANVGVWTPSDEAFTGPTAREAWAKGEIEWGVFGVPERYSDFDPDWGRRWPAEEIWAARER